MTTAPDELTAKNAESTKNQTSEVCETSEVLAFTFYILYGSSTTAVIFHNSRVSGSCTRTTAIYVMSPSFFSPFG